nr:aspartyl protease family protein At5g10770-like [Ipomoea trifida]
MFASRTGKRRTRSQSCRQNPPLPPQRTGETFTNTRVATDQGTSFYFIDVRAIAVGGKQLSISPVVFKSSGTIIDSGTVITRLPPAAYSALRSAFR